MPLTGKSLGQLWAWNNIVQNDHPHMDHWGLIDELPKAWPLWTGSKSAEFMRLTTEIVGGKIDREIRTWPQLHQTNCNRQLHG
jgi:hypothetical protein